MQGTIPRLPEQDNRTQRFSQLVAGILNSLLLQGYVRQTSPAGYEIVAANANFVNAARTFAPPPPPFPPGAADADRVNALKAFLPHAAAVPAAAAADTQGILANQIFGS